jgi:hypothetical protein
MATGATAVLVPPRARVYAQLRRWRQTRFPAEYSSIRTPANEARFQCRVFLMELNPRIHTNIHTAPWRKARENQFCMTDAQKLFAGEQSCTGHEL